MSPRADDIHQSEVKVEMASTTTTTATKTAKANHPPTSQMIIEAIETLNERRGSSVQAIKKYMSSNFTFDVVKSNFLIKKYLKTAVEKGDLVQTSGKGATGSFKLGPVMKKTIKVDEKKSSKSKEKESKASAKTSKADKEKKSLKRTASMEKKSMKSPTAKPKAPKKASK